MHDGLSCELQARLTVNGEKCFGPGTAELMRRIEKTHSLSAATKEMGMAYSKAWKILKRCETLLGIKLITSRTGGEHGGGAELTDAGRELLARYDTMTAELAATASAIVEREFGSLTFCIDEAEK